MQPRIDSSVVLPLPEGPISSVSSPGLSDRLTPLSARVLRAPWPSSLTILRASSTTLAAGTMPGAALGAIAMLLPSALIG